jgi:hypothetical protein
MRLVAGGLLLVAEKIFNAFIKSENSIYASNG